MHATRGETKPRQNNKEHLMVYYLIMGKNEWQIRIL